MTFETELASVGAVEGAGAEGRMPPLFVRLGVGLGSLGYCVMVGFDVAVSGFDPWEGLAALGFAAAFALSFRRPRAAGTLALAVGLFETLSSFAEHGIMSGSGLVLPVLVTMAGLLVGERAALAMGVLAGVGSAVAAIGFGPHGAGLSPDESQRVVVIALTVGITAVLTFAAVRSHRRALAASEAARLRTLREADERRALEQQLQHAQRLETMGLLAGGVAHDFNNLLTAIAGNASLLAEERSPEVRELAQEILDVQRSGSLLTRQLLAFARRDSRRPERLDLERAVNGMRRLLERILGQHLGLELECAGEVQVMADLGQVEQVLANLVANARDASPPEGRVTVRVKALGNDEAAGLGCTLQGDVAMLEVADLGEGMSPEVRDRIFEPFFTTKPRGHGTGLGLSTVHGIVGQSGGQVTVESAPGSGSRFRVFLPLAPVSQVREPAAPVQ